MLWDTRDPELLMFMLQMLTRIGDKSSAPAIEPLVRHEDPNVAQAAIEALGAVGAKEAIPTLLEALRGDLWFQLAAIEALGKLPDPRGVAALLSLIPTSLATEAALRALAAIGDPSVLPRLVALLLEQPLAPYGDAALAAVARAIEHSANETALAGTLVPLRDGETSARIRARLAEILRAPADNEAEEAVRRDAATIVVATPIPQLIAPALMIGWGSEWLDQLCAHHARRLGPLLLSQLQSHEVAVRAAVLSHGRLALDDAPKVRSKLTDSIIEVRIAACTAVARMGDTASVPLLVERLRSDEAEEREAAVAALAQLPNSALADVEACLDPSANEGVTTAALAALERAARLPPTPRLQLLARHQSPVVRRAALRVAALEGSGADQLLLHGLADIDASVQAESLDLLVRRGGERAIATLVALLSIADSLRFRVIRGLGQLRAAAATRKLIHLFPDAFPHEQVEIVAALAGIATPEARVFVGDRLKEADLELRRAAARGLAAWAGPDDLQLLRSLAADRDWNVRDEAARALGRLGPTYARDTLLELARDVESVVAATARQALAGAALVVILLAS